MIQSAFLDGHTAEDCTWQKVFLVPKGGGDFQGIFLVEVLWKTVMGILNLRLVVVIRFHYTLHTL